METTVGPVGSHFARPLMTTSVWPILNHLDTPNRIPAKDRA